MPREQSDEQMTSAIASWDTDEDDPMWRSSKGLQYRCVDCTWTGGGATGYDHHKATGHAIRGAQWPADWPNCQFTGANAEGRRT